MRSNELVGHGLVVMTEVGDLKTTSDQSLTLLTSFSLACRLKNLFELKKE